MDVLPSTNPEKWERWAPDDSAGTKDWFWFERADADFWYDFVEKYQWPLITTGLATYYIGMLAARSFMKNRKPYTNLRPFIVTYHVIITLISIVSFIRLSVVLSDGFGERDWIHQRLCIRSSKLTTPLVFWGVVLGWSKFAQTLDSFFLILLKKDVPFFQIYHHSIMMFTSGILIGLAEPILIVISSVNMIQHSITYPYFAAKVLKIRLPSFVPKLILAAELIQMLIGLASEVYTEYVISTGGYCVRHPTSIRFLRTLFSTILILVVYEIYNYVNKRRQRQKKE